MKNSIKWKVLIITCVVCLLPIILGVALWGRLPESVAIHFDINNNPDNFASKGMAVFGLPVMMVAFQIFCCVTYDINTKKHGEKKKFENAVKWIIPVLTIVLMCLTFAFALGIGVDIRRCAMIIAGVVLLVIGNYLPKLDYIKNKEVDTQKARKINRFVGFETVIMGILAIITAFLPSIVSVIWLFMIIPYGIIASVYSMVVIKR